MMNDIEGTTPARRQQSANCASTAANYNATDGANLTRWDEVPPPLDVNDPAALAADAARPQPFLHVLLKALTFAKKAHDAEIAGRASASLGARFEAFMDGLNDDRLAQVRAFLAWAAEAAGGEPTHDLAGFAPRFAKRLVHNPVLRSMWDDALYRPRDFAADAHTALYWANRLGLDIERVFATPPRERN